MNTLNKTFKAGDVLQAVELNSIVSKINDIVSNLPSGTGGDNPLYNGAQIIAAINEDGDSTVGINADKVIIDGDVTLTDKLTTMTADIGTLNAATANIKNAIIEVIEAGDVTITGTLNYNRLVGNVVTVNPDEDRAIPLDATYVKIGDFTGAYADIWLQCPTASGSITIPVGHTVFIESKQNVSVCVNDASNLYGTHLLAGWVYDHIEDVPVGEGDSERYYVYHWGLVEYNGNDIKTYNNSPNGYNLQGAAVHSYMWTGTRWVETTNLSNIKTMERSQLS